MQIDPVLPGRAWLRLTLAGVVGGLAALLPWAVLLVVITLEGNPDGSAGWTVLGVVTVPFGAMSAIIAGLLALRGRALSGGVLGFGLGAAAFVAAFLEPEHPGFALLGASGLLASAAAGALLCRIRRPRAGRPASPGHL
ncbi:MAG TPA: hypothetical protein PK668_20655 [Myxococcota bacterium]|nr:hypothetical protein [Myxococcota bacterium]HRY96242.1 hypothetical protein [Myxococcota bacterium]